MRRVVPQYFPVIGWNALLLHDGCHHLGRALSINLTPHRDAILADDAHPLQIGVKLESTIDESTVSAITFEAKDDFGVSMGLVEVEPSEKECLDLHGITDEFTLGLDNRVVGSHVGKDGIDEGSPRNTLEHLIDAGFVVGNGGVKLALIGWYQCMEIHIVFSKGAGLVEAAKLDHSAHDDLILGDTENALIFQPLHSVDNTKGHTDRECRWDCDGDEIKEFLDQIHHLHILVDEADQDSKGAH